MNRNPAPRPAAGPAPTPDSGAAASAARAEPIASQPERGFLLATKLQPPHLRRDLLPRPGLVEQLEASDRRLVLVSAPPGFGKSTLLGEWVRGTGRTVAWISLDPDDNDPSRFWRYLLAAMESVHPGLWERVLPLRRGVEPPPPEALVGTMLNELSDHPAELTLVLDNYQAIESPEIHEALAHLLERQPPGLRLIIASRSDPPLPLARMRARGELTELRAGDLRFSSVDAAALLLEAWGLDLPPDSVTALTEITEGWATGLQLAALSLQGASEPARVIAGFTGGHRHVLDYLTEEVLQRQTERVRAFLLETSILDRLSGPLCDAVTKRSDSQVMLESLERANLFLIPLDEERRWYRYHNLFADLLRQRLRMGAGERQPDLHRRAMAWSDEHGLVDDAIRHALAAGDSGSAAGIVERHVDEVLARGEGATLRGWLSALPPEVVRARASLSLVQAIAAFNAGRLESAESLLADAERAVAGWGAETEPVDVHFGSALAAIPATVASVRASLATARGEPERARELAQRALSLLKEGDWGPRLSVRWNLALADWMRGRIADAEREFSALVAEGRATGNAHMAISAGAILGRVQRAQGRLGAALRTYEGGLELGTADGRPLVLTAGVAQIGLAEVLYERDQIEGALRQIEPAIELCRRLTSTQHLASGLAAMAWIRQAMGDPAGALAAMEEGYRVLPSTDVVSLYNPVPAERARLLLTQGQTAEVAIWLEERSLEDKDEPSYAREREYLVLARLLLARAAPDRAVDLLRRLQTSAEAEGRTGSLIEILVLGALASAALGDHTRAAKSLAEALAWGRPEGFVRVFADEGRPLADLLGGLLRGGRTHGVSSAAAVPSEYAGHLLRAFRRAPVQGRREAAAGLVEPLTHREIEVLEKLASGRSNQQIANEFVVTLDTVKKHVTHVLGKLGAANRTQAVTRARELGLIS